MFRSFLLFCFLLATICGSAQNFSNKGKDFWVGYGYHHGMITGNDQNMVLYFTSDVAANIKVEIPAVGWSKTYAVAANGVVESDIMPKSGAQDARMITEGVHKTGIHITSDNPVVAYAHIYNSSVSGATLLFPVNTLGRDYYSLNFTQRSNADNSNSWAYVIATEDNTVVEIIPSAKTLTHAAGAAFTVLLNKGQMYNLMGATSGTLGEDLTGTRIRSISSGASGCKRIAVFSGSGRLSINCSPGTVTTSDNVIQQAFPKNAWGKNYLTVPTSNLANNFYRVAVSDPTTVVKVDGVRVTNLVNGFYYEFSSNVPKSIVADKPVMVAQYITSTNGSSGPACGNSFSGNGDPEMIYLSPTEQTIDNITLNSTAHYNITLHYINVILKTSAVNSFTLDGTKQLTSFTQHPRDPAYSYAVFTVKEGAHQLRANSGFNAIAYGYGLTESYGYNAGTNIRDLYQFLTLENPFATPIAPATCKNIPFNFVITLPYKPSTLTWDFGNNPFVSPNKTVVLNNPAPDSSFVRDEKTLYVFRLADKYHYLASGTFPLKVTANSPSADGCEGEQEIPFEVQVMPQMVADFKVSHSGCASDTAFFTDVSTYPSGRPFAWSWNFGDGTLASAQNPHKAFTSANTYKINFRAINEIGCTQDTTKNFVIAPQPEAKFIFTGTACEKTAVTFTDQSTIVGGTIVKWYWSFGDGQTVVTTTNAAVNNTFATAGTYQVSLQVENASGCKSVAFSKQIVVNNLPQPAFTASDGCLPNAQVKFANATTVDGTSSSPLQFLWSFGDNTTSTEQEPLHQYSKPGPFAVKLSATSALGCTADTSISINSVYPQPQAAFTTAAAVCLSDSVQFKDASLAANSTVNSWYWTFGDGGTSNVANPVKKYLAAGTYTVTLVVKSATGCASDTLKKQLVVSPLPLADFSPATVTCSNAPFTITDRSSVTNGSVTKWHWTFGDGTAATYNNNQTFNKTYNTAGSYTIALVVEF